MLSNHINEFNINLNIFFLIYGIFCCIPTPSIAAELKVLMSTLLLIISWSFSRDSRGSRLTYRACCNASLVRASSMPLGLGNTNDVNDNSLWTLGLAGLMPRFLWSCGVLLLCWLLCPLP